MAATVYILCALTSVLCALLLFRGYRRAPSQLLFWGAICFGGLALNNILLVVDLLIVPSTTDLSIYRNITALGSVTVFIFGLIRDVV